MPQVTYSASFTRNMGDYEFLRLEMGVTDEPRGEEKVSEAFNRVKDFVESRLLDDVDALETQIVNLRQKIRDGAHAGKIKSAAKKDEKEGK